MGPTPPSVGRIVHVRLPGLTAQQPEPLDVAAIVTAVNGDDIAAIVFPPGGVPMNVTAQHIEPAPGQEPLDYSWHWPPIR